MTQKTLSRKKLQELLRSFKQKNGAEFHLTALGYFGSYARDEADADSDVDIVFMTDAPNLFATVRLREELVGLLGCPVDIIRFRERMNPWLKSRIEREAVYV